jgi:hypothetical protein
MTARKRPAKKAAPRKRAAPRKQAAKKAEPAEGTISKDEVQTATPKDPPPPAKTVDDVIDDVLAGKYGVGQDRRVRLKEAGYDHVKVQKELVRRANNR